MLKKTNYRIGRTGRAGHKGFAHTLVTEKDSEFCAHLVKNFETAGQSISPGLLNIALKCPWFKGQHDKQQQGSSFAGSSTKQRTGLGYSSLPRPKQPGTDPSTDAAGPGPSFYPPSMSQQPTISKQIDRAKSLVNSGNVGGMDRVSMMRSALKVLIVVYSKRFYYLFIYL